MLLIPKTEIYARIDKLQKEMVAAGFDGAIVLLNSDMYYLTGTVQNSQLFVPAQGEPVLAIRKSLERGRKESLLKNIVPMRSTRELPGILDSFGYSSFSKIGMELDVLPVNNLPSYQRVFPGVKIEDVSPLIKKIRMIKSPFEVDLLREALKVIDGAYKVVPGILREGMLEIELASLFEAAMRRGGLSGYSKMRTFNQELYLGNTCVGSNGFYPSGFDGPVGGSGMSPSHPQGAGMKIVNRNEVIYIDYTCVINGYTGDQTRIFCIGELEPKMVKAHQDALFINEEVVKSLKVGTPVENAHILALKLAEELGYKDHFMGYKENQVRFLGHGLGLELDEMPVFAKGLKMPLEPGMTFALEPKFVFPEGAIGTENSYVMTENGPENLSITPQNITYVD